MLEGQVPQLCSTQGTALDFLWAIAVLVVGEASAIGC